MKEASLTYNGDEVVHIVSGDPVSLSKLKTIKDPDKDDLVHKSFYYIQTEKEWRDHSQPWIYKDFSGKGVFIATMDSDHCRVDDVNKVIEILKSPWD